MTFVTSNGPLSACQWLRAEWQRTGMPLYRANVACGLKNAATRKYLTQDWLWYFPPAEMMDRLIAYANAHGEPTGRPYFSLDGKRSVTATEWARLRHPWNHEHGLTNVWSHPPLNGAERYRGNGRRVAPRVHNPGRNATAHLNQKPLEFMRRIVKVASNRGDTVWEPFGGLCTASVAAVAAGRNAFAAEPDPHFFSLAERRLAGCFDCEMPSVTRRLALNKPAPHRHEFPAGDDMGELVGNVRNALGALPVFFRTATRIEGLDGGELFNLSAVLGSAIEVQVVETLNRIRDVWDPDNRWPRHRFVRSAQTFPDVRLQAQGQETPQT